MRTLNFEKSMLCIAPMLLWDRSKMLNDSAAKLVNDEAGTFDNWLWDASKYSMSSLANNTSWIDLSKLYDIPKNLKFWRLRNKSECISVNLLFDKYRTWSFFVFLKVLMPISVIELCDKSSHWRW